MFLLLTLKLTCSTLLEYEKQTNPTEPYNWNVRAAKYTELPLRDPAVPRTPDSTGYPTRRVRIRTSDHLLDSHLVSHCYSPSYLEHED